MSTNMITKILWISNMTCVNCENIIEHELSQCKGVDKVKASYSSGTVTVTYDESIISLSEIENVIIKLDYWVKQEKESVTARYDKTKKADMADKTGKDKNNRQMDFTTIIGIVIILFAGYRLASHFGLLNILNTFPVAKEGMGYGMLFLIGVLTSVHCVAMCGGICLSQCVPQKLSDGVRESKFMAMRPSLLYNLGRVISYTVIGGIVGAIGSVVSFSGPMKGFVQILAGVFMVIMGVNMLNVFPWLRRFNPRMPKVFAKKIYEQRRSNSPLYIGLLNGLMPCGPLQAMQIYALSTGSPVKGAMAMFLFSIGTVPLMFAFGALSSFLNKKFTGRLMKASAALVVILGVFMFYNGIALSGISLPSISAVTSQASADTAKVASIEDGVQVVRTGLDSGRYEPIIVQKGIPVRWIIQAEDGDINGCNKSIVVSKYNLQKDLAVGENVIEFTPEESGSVPFSCWMGMIRSKITVVDDLKNIDSNTSTDANAGNIGSSGGSCCAGGLSGGSSSNSDASAGLPSCH